VARIHILIDQAERERFRRQAKREGKSLTAWLRDAARDRLAAAERQPKMRTLEELRAFFAACGARETGREPDWDEHRRVIEQSIGSGAAAR
jgi:hypothetical protein